MDRFLGAIFTPGNDGSPNWIKSQDYSENNMTTAKLLTKASGYYYQWGRKDPILTSTVTRISQPYKLEDTPVYDAKGDKIDTNPYILMSNGIDTSIESPLKVMNYSFFREARSWGTSKSKNIFDPCPEGWRVPHSPSVLPPATTISLNKRGIYTSYLGYFPYAGYRLSYDHSWKNDGREQFTLCWTGQISKYLNDGESNAYCLFIGWDRISNGNNNNRYVYRPDLQINTKDAANVRCVQYQ
jgi:hypothetical protein